MIVTVSGIKSATGKTTIAVHLAVLRAYQNHNVLLIDTCNQTAAEFSNKRRIALKTDTNYITIQLQDISIRMETLKLQQFFDDIIIDSDGRDTNNLRAALSVSDQLVVPFLPTNCDVWSMDKLATLVDEAQGFNEKLKAIAFANRVDVNGQDTEELQKAVSNIPLLTVIPYQLGDRKIFRAALDLGLTVSEMPRSEEQQIATEEIQQLYRTIYSS